jgi:hypothetical protein
MNKQYLILHPRVGQPFLKMAIINTIDCCYASPPLLSWHLFRRAPRNKML